MGDKLTWAKFLEDCNSCVRCDLSKTRKNVVVYRGSVKAPLLFIGEGPGASEDEQGIPFVGSAGKLLDLLITAIDFPGDKFHICNIVKCRPPENRAPSTEESKACKNLLATQFKFVKPKIIVLLGSTAYKNFTGSNEGITEVRGKWIEKSGYLIMPTIHPAYVLRNNTKRILLWEDLSLVRDKMVELGYLEKNDLIPDMPQGRK